MTLRAVIFDLGHTIWDYAPSEAARRLSVVRLHQRLESSMSGDLPSPAALDRALGAAVERWLEYWRSDRLEQPPSEELVREALQAVAISPPDELLRELTSIFFGAELDILVVEPDTLAAIATLHERGLVMGCITNTILLEEAIVDALRRLGLVRYLRSVVVSSAMGYGKPHPSLFRRALRELNVSPREALFVGDRLVDDVSGAKGVGMRAVLTRQYRQEPLDGATALPDAVIRRLSELPDHLVQIEAKTRFQR